MVRLKDAPEEVNRALQILWDYADDACLSSRSKDEAKDEGYDVSTESCHFITLAVPKRGEAGGIVRKRIHNNDSGSKSPDYGTDSKVSTKDLNRDAAAILEARGERRKLGLCEEIAETVKILGYHPTIGVNGRNEVTFESSVHGFAGKIVITVFNSGHVEVLRPEVLIAPGGSITMIENEKKSWVPVRSDLADLSAVIGAVLQDFDRDVMGLRIAQEHDGSSN